jgi:hypothetical protein
VHQPEGSSLVDKAVAVRSVPPRPLPRLWRCLSAASAFFVVTASVSACSNDTAASASVSASLPDGSWTDVATGDLVTQTPYDGLVGPASTTVIQSSAAGTITRVPNVGTILNAGDPAAYVDESPILALPGDIPAYRDILAPPAVPATSVNTDATAGATSVPTPASAALQGSDVEQVQRFLAATGYFGGSINGRFSSALGRSSRDWRTAHGMSNLLGFTKQEISFIPGSGPWTVTKVPISLGQEFAGGPLIEVSTGGLAVSVSLDTAPPSGATYSIASAQGADDSASVPVDPAGPATPSEGGKYVITLVPQGAGAIDVTIGTTVIVEQNNLLAAEVTKIPVAAVRLDASGRPIAHCRDAANSADRDCPLELGATDGRDVEVRNGLSKGMQVAVSP